jgi:hypothetical protein
VGAFAGVGASEPHIEEEEVELDCKERVAKQQPAHPTAEVIRCRFAPRDSRVLCAQAKQQLPFQEFVLDPSFLPTMCHRMPCRRSYWEITE